VPMFYGNLTLDLNPVKPFAPTSFLSNTWINLRLQHIGSRQSPIQRVSTNRPDALANLQNVEPDVVLVHTGLRLRDVYFQGLGFSVNVYNLLDQRWHQGGSTSFPYPQAGRWFLGLLEFQADL
jgi:outer membrane receptor protein involved in Fe transport